MLVFTPKTVPVEFFIVTDDMFPNVPVTTVMFMDEMFVAPLSPLTFIERFRTSAEAFVLAKTGANDVPMKVIPEAKTGDIKKSNKPTKIIQYFGFINELMFRQNIRFTPCNACVM